MQQCMSTVRFLASLDTFARHINCKKDMWRAMPTLRQTPSSPVVLQCLDVYKASPGALEKCQKDQIDVAALVWPA